MDQVTQQNAALVEEAAASSSMREQAAELAQLMSAFKTDGARQADPVSQLYG